MAADLIRLGAAVSAANAWAGTVVSVQDADSVHVQVMDTLISTLVVLSVRLVGINARESSQPGGREARAALAAELPAGTVVTLRAVSRDEYSGRVDGVLITQAGVDVGGWLVASGWAAPWNGKGERPLPPWPRVAAT